MFCDLAGSAALALRLDPEDLREIIGRYHACVAETVSRFDGFVAKYMGDCFLSVQIRGRTRCPDALCRSGLLSSLQLRAASGPPS